MTRDGTTLTIDIFALLPILAIVAGLVLILWRRRHRKPPNENTDDTPGFSIRALLAPIPLPEGIKLAGFGLWAVLFATLGFGVFFAVITALFALPNAGEDTGFNLLRGALLTVAAITATLGAVVALPFTLIRVRTTERQTRTQEEGYVTQQINEAVANLAAQKEVNKLGRQTEFEHEGRKWQVFNFYSLGRGPEEPNESFYRVKHSSWENITLSEPNIEVRIGAILSLERIARQCAETAVREKDPCIAENRAPDGILDHDAARDHVRIMEILCAYVRETSRTLEPWDVPFHDESNLAAENSTKQWGRSVASDDTNQAVRQLLVRQLPTVRTDIQAAVRTIGRRTREQRNCEGSFSTKETISETWHGHRLDLRASNLQRADLSNTASQPMNLANARMEGTRLDGAAILGTNLEGANLEKARFDVATMRGAKLTNAKLYYARFRQTDLRMAKLQGARLDGANLREADLRWIEFDRRTGLYVSSMAKAGIARATLWPDLIKPEILKDCFGDASVVFEGTWPDGYVVSDTEGVQRANTNGKLAHWKNETLETSSFDELWFEHRLMTKAQINSAF